MAIDLPVNRSSGRVRHVVSLIRVRQWPKNVLVLAAPLAAGRLLDLGTAVVSAQAFLAWCCAATCIYILNDAVDRKADRTHPVKRSRPLASGALSLPVAGVIFSLSLGLALVLSTMLGLSFTSIIGAYVILNLAYSARLKHVPIIEMAVVASGFVLRALSGAAAVEVEASQWFAIVATFGSLLIVVGKRLAELRAGGASRRVLESYTEPFLRHAQTLAASVLLLAYCLWAFGEGVGDRVLAHELSVVPVALGVLYYLSASHGAGVEAPEKLLRDKSVLAIGAAWLALYGWGLAA